MKTVNVMVMAVITAAMVMLSGCEEQRPIAMVFLVDPTTSARENRKLGAQYLRSLLQGRYLPTDSRVAIIRADCQPTVRWEGKKQDASEILAAYDEALRGRDCGTDPVGALELAREWLLQPQQQTMSRKIVCGWIDLIPDPHKDPGGQVKTFRAPERFTWPNTKSASIELFLFGVATEQQRKLQKTWEPYFASEPMLFGPAHRIRPEDVKLTQGGLL